MKFTKELLREMIKEEIAALKEEKSFIGKIKYAPAEALMAIERAIRKQTGIRGVLDPSVIYDNEGNLIIPEPDKLKDWQKDYPALYAATQAATNMFASDPLSLAATLTGVGGVASKAASKLAKVAKGTKGFTPTITKGVDTATRAWARRWNCKEHISGCHIDHEQDMEFQRQFNERLDFCMIFICLGFLNRVRRALWEQEQKIMFIGV
jgi:hypothetical protein